MRRGWSSKSTTENKALTTKRMEVSSRVLKTPEEKVGLGEVCQSQYNCPMGTKNGRWSWGGLSGVGKIEM